MDKQYTVKYLMELLKKTKGEIICDKFGIIITFPTLPTLYFRSNRINEMICKLEGLTRPDLKVDTPVLVWNNGSKQKYRRHFSNWTKDNKIVVFFNGRSSFTETGRGFDLDIYDNWELANKQGE